MVKNKLNELAEFIRQLPEKVSPPSPVDGTKEDGITDEDYKELMRELRDKPDGNIFRPMVDTSHMADTKLTSSNEVTVKSESLLAKLREKNRELREKSRK